MTTCPHCGQDEATDHTRCRAYLADHRLADAAMHVLALAPTGRRLAVALAVVKAWTGETP